jgi:hypothetical protein
MVIVEGPDNRAKAGSVAGMATHPKRPRDFSQAAKLVVDIVSGEVQDRDRPATRVRTPQLSNWVIAAV